jgi:O-antigen/teichoic acid export membrane protein
LGIAEQAGYYSISSPIAEMVYVLPSLAGMILFPKIIAMATVVGKWRFAKKVTVCLGSFMFLVTLMMALLGKPMIQLVFGEAFAPSWLPSIWLLSTIFLYTINTCFMNFFAPIGMPMISVYASGLALQVTLLLALVLIPLQGIAAASQAALAGSCSWIAGSLFFLYRLRITKRRVVLLCRREEITD